MNQFGKPLQIVKRATAVALIAVGASFSATLPTAKSIAAEMGAGWNLGNTLELSNVQPIPTKALFDSVKAAGFKTVRIPAAWDSHADQTTHVINTDWMAQVKTVVDYAIQDSLFVVLNIHWDGGWVEGKIDSAASRPAMKATMYAKQGAYWRQIATTFKDYDRHLLFASANEPSVDTQKNLSVLMGLHQIFIDTVRATGGNNATRALILQGPSTSIDHSVDWVTTALFPTDPTTTEKRLMWEVHFYPYQFCLMSQDADWGKPFYYWGKGYHSTTDQAHNPTWGEESYVDSQFNRVKTKFVDQGIPVLVGEFGALKRLTLTGDSLKLHILSRRHFYNYIVNSAVSKGLIPIAWDAGGTGDGSMSVFRRSNTEGAIYDLGLLNAIRNGDGLSKLAGDTTSDYTVATGANAMKILYSALDSMGGQVNPGVAKANISAYDSIVVRAFVNGNTSYDSAGTRSGYLSLSLVTMSYDAVSKKDWTWREKSLGALTMDGWKNYSIPLSKDTTNTTALVPADPTNIEFFALQAYSKAYNGTIYVDYIVFKTKSGTSDTLYTFDQKAPETFYKDVVSVSLIPVANVAADQEWKTATKAYRTTSIHATAADRRTLGIAAANGMIRASFQADGQAPAMAELMNVQGRTIWSRSFVTVPGTNELEIPNQQSGFAILRIRQTSSDLVGKVYCP
jgi:hypothetical protein